MSPALIDSRSARWQTPTQLSEAEDAIENGGPKEGREKS
jgi:hypothetical protein